MYPLRQYADDADVIDYMSYIGSDSSSGSISSTSKDSNNGDSWNDGDIDRYNSGNMTDLGLETQEWNDYDDSDSEDEDDQIQVIRRHDLLPKENSYEWYIMLLGRMIMKLRELDDTHQNKFFNVRDYSCNNGFPKFDNICHNVCT